MIREHDIHMGTEYQSYVACYEGGDIFTLERCGGHHLRKVIKLSISLVGLLM